MTETVAQPLSESTVRAAWDRVLLGAWRDGDFSALDEVYAADFTYHVPPFPDMNKQELRDFITAFRAGFQDIRAEVKEEVISGSTSVQRWQVEARFGGKTPFLPVDPTGRTTMATGVLLCHWANGKVTEAWHFGDWMGWLTQAGVLPPLHA
jgi:ketosteroid isomerase-like protein